MAVKTFNINQSPVSLAQGDTLTFKLVVKSTTTNNFTASFASAGNLNVSSLAVATGYASTTCPYFDSASIKYLSSSLSTYDTLVFSSGVSSFHDNNYIFVPNPLTGSESSLYNTYGDVDYGFAIKPQDIILTYLSDNTYVESRVLNVGATGSLVTVKLDNTLSPLYRNNILSGSFQRFLVLSRIEDETSAYLTFQKREGKTSYGFVIPDNLAPDVLANIDVITKEVKQKLINEQSAIDNISGGSF